MPAALHSKCTRLLRLVNNQGCKLRNLKLAVPILVASVGCASGCGKPTEDTWTAGEEKPASTAHVDQPSGEVAAKPAQPGCCGPGVGELHGLGPASEPVGGETKRRKLRRTHRRARARAWPWWGRWVKRSRATPGAAPAGFRYHVDHDGRPGGNRDLEAARTGRMG